MERNQSAAFAARVTGRPACLPAALTFRDARSFFVTEVFVLLSVAVPALLHRYPWAGPTLLPMHFFVLAAGLAFGWRAGLLVGLTSPLASFLVSDMPAAVALPRITAELATYGLVAGLLRGRLPVVWSLLGAMAAGRLVMLLGFVVAYGVAGQGPAPLEAALAAVKRGWPGALAQLALIPAGLALACRLWRGKSKGL